MNKSLIKNTFLIFTAVLFLSACTKNQTSTHNRNNQGQDSVPLPISEVLKGNHPIAIIQNKQLLVVDPEFPDPQPILGLGEKEIPPVIDLNTFKISPTKNFIVWYAPEKGFLKLNLISKELTSIHEPSSWLNKNPFFAYLGDKDTVIFIDNNGTEFVTINIVTNQKEITRIPYPFGNLFSVSPDGQKLVFVSGFGQSEKNPEYMFTDITGANPKRFITNATLNKRHLITWLPDSSGVVVVSTKSELLFVSEKQPNQQEIFYKTSDDAEITDLAKVENLIYILTSENKWHVIDSNSRKEVGRIPLEIAEEIHRPKFYPWFDSNFLIEETLRLDPEQYNRLWLSNYIGVKKSIIDKYQETNITSDTPSL